MSNHCDSSCGHTHIKYDIPRCQTIMTHHAVTHILNMTLMSNHYDSPCGHTYIKYDIPLCQTIMTHHAVTQILNMTYLDVKPL